MLKVLDLFSGIGGFSIGLEATQGFKTIAFCEIDPFCQKVLAKHWPGVPCFSDIKTLNKEELDKYAIDVICGGFPCQPVSCAGKRKGDQDKRWLWPEFYRIIRLVKPGWVLVENVPGLLSADSGRLFGGILRDLASIGYDAEWNIVSAASVGAPHLRRRVFIIAWNVAHTESGRCGFRAASDIGATCGEGDASSNSGTILADSESGKGDGRKLRNVEGTLRWRSTSVNAAGTGSQEVADSETAMRKLSIDSWAGRDGFADGSAKISDPEGTLSRHGHSNDVSLFRNGTKDGQRESAIRSRNWWTVECRLGRTFDGLLEGIHGPWRDGWEDGTPRLAKGQKDRVNRLRALGNAICPPVAQYVGECILNSLK